MSKHLLLLGSFQGQAVCCIHLLSNGLEGSGKARPIQSGFSWSGRKHDDWLHRQAAVSIVHAMLFLLADRRWVCLHLHAEFPPSICPGRGRRLWSEYRPSG
jgi:hypothetical protein